MSEDPDLLQLGIAVSRGRPVLRGEVLWCTGLAVGEGLSVPAAGVPRASVLRRVEILS